MERIFKLGTIVCYTGDVTNPELKLVHVKHSREIKSYLLKQSEAARLKRRTLNTVDIGAHGADMQIWIMMVFRILWNNTAVAAQLILLIYVWI